MKKIDPIKEGMYAIETLVKGCLVKVTPFSNRIWRVGAYSRTSGLYRLHAEDNSKDSVFVKVGNWVFAIGAGAAPGKTLIQK